MVQTIRRPTISNVAEAAGVSKTAVSFAFNQPDRLAPETANRIRSVAASLGYRPHPVARMLSQGRTQTIGVLVPQALSVVFENPFFGTFTAGVAKAAEASGYVLQFVSPLHGSLARAMDRASVDGVVAVGLSAQHPEVEQIRQGGVPMVLVDSTALPTQPGLDVDDEGGARLAAAHLLELGHRAFAVLAIESSDPPDVEDPDDVPARRLRGYRSALAGAGIDLPAAAVVIAPSTSIGGASSFDALWDSGQRPTAILAMSDAMALGAIRAARERGINVPSAMSIVGFDDIELAQFSDPALTTIHQPIARKGEMAVELLLGILEGRVGSNQHEILATRLVVRASTGPAPAAVRRSAEGGASEQAPV